MRFRFSRFARGFTLIEVLLVIAILAILAAVVIIAINPAKQLASARDSQRQSDVYSILNALYQYSLDHDGAFPTDLPQSPVEICATGSVACDNMYNIEVITENQKYLVSVPKDPQCGIKDGVCVGWGEYCNIRAGMCLSQGVGYFIERSDNGRITVTANSSELGSISVTR